MKIYYILKRKVYGGTNEVFRVINMPNRAASFDWANLQYMILLTVYLALLGQSRQMRQF